MSQCKQRKWSRASVVQTPPLRSLKDGLFGADHDVSYDFGDLQLDRPNQHVGQVLHGSALRFAGDRQGGEYLAGPDPDGTALPAYAFEDLDGIREKRFGKPMHPQSLGLLLARLGFSWQKARPSHPQKDLAAQSAFQESSGAAQKKSADA